MNYSAAVTWTAITRVCRVRRRLRNTSTSTKWNLSKLKAPENKAITMYWCIDRSGKNPRRKAKNVSEYHIASDTSFQRNFVSVTIVDKPVPIRAYASLPSTYLMISEDETNVKAVFAKRNIPLRTQFGPFEGDVKAINSDEQMSAYRANRVNAPLLFLDESKVLDVSNESKCESLAWQQNIKTTFSKSIFTSQRHQIGWDLLTLREITSNRICCCCSRTENFISKVVNSLRRNNDCVSATVGSMRTNSACRRLLETKATKRRSHRSKKRNRRKSRRKSKKSK